ncbi:MAG TPA: hypothetical protein VN750_26565 [Steroidobacteraceae bacterium]|nr:hypothetical protein [Steroidobacteraceae bacterium]
MATKLDKVLKREIDIGGKPYMLAISPEGLKLTDKGRRKGQELSWKDLVGGQAAVAVEADEASEQAPS